MKRHECDKTPAQLQYVKMEQRLDGNYTGWYLGVGDCETEITYCPYCGEELLLYLPQIVETVTRMTNEDVYKNYGVTLLRDDGDHENYALKSATSIISGFLDISEESAECLVKTLVDAVKHEMRCEK
jgi:hypothetical protein